MCERMDIDASPNFAAAPRDARSPEKRANAPLASARLFWKWMAEMTEFVAGIGNTIARALTPKLLAIQ